MQTVASLDIEDGILYPASDGKPLGETPRHIRNIFYSIYSLGTWFEDDANVLVAANMFVYYARGEPRKNVSPDIFIVKGVPRDRVPERRRYLVWNEERGLDLVIELTSESTVEEDLGPKKALYQDVLKVQEYILFDPWEEYLSPQLLGYRLIEGIFQEVPLVNGRLPSEVLGLLLEADGEMLRYVDPKTGRRLPIPPEVDEARHKAELAQRRQSQARKRAEAARQEEEQARKRAEAETERLRKEIAELRKRLAEEGNGN